MYSNMPLPVIRTTPAGTWLRVRTRAWYLCHFGASFGVLEQDLLHQGEALYRLQLLQWYV